MAKTTDEIGQSIRSLGVLIETVIDQNRAVMEAVSDMQAKVARLTHIEEAVTGTQADIKTIRAAVTDTNQQVHNHEHRITRLEASAA